jgi:hypothetical protein
LQILCAQGLSQTTVLFSQAGEDLPQAVNDRMHRKCHSLSSASDLPSRGVYGWPGLALIRYQMSMLGQPPLLRNSLSDAPDLTSSPAAFLAFVHALVNSTEVPIPYEKATPRDRNIMARDARYVRHRCNSCHLGLFQCLFVSSSTDAGLCAHAARTLLTEGAEHIAHSFPKDRTGDQFGRGRLILWDQDLSSWPSTGDHDGSRVVGEVSRISDG